MAADTEFLRRIHLDMTGKIPTAEEVLDFLKDGSPNKRQDKIDDLLQSEASIGLLDRIVGELAHRQAR